MSHASVLQLKFMKPACQAFPTLAFQEPKYTDNILQKPGEDFMQITSGTALSILAARRQPTKSSSLALPAQSPFTTRAAQA